MKCAKCNSQVSIADRTCPKCGQDLLQFGATISYEPPPKDPQRYGQGVKDMVFGTAGKEMRESLKSLSPEERKLLLPVEERFSQLLSRHLSDEELEDAFEKEIIPAMNNLSGDKDAEKILEKVEAEIKKNLGDIYSHYRNKGEDVLKILRAGEFALLLMKEGIEDIDLSVKMFPFFKASEASCWLHSESRYQELGNNELIKKMSLWLRGNRKNIHVENLPDWIEKWVNQDLLGIVNGIRSDDEREKKRNLGGSKRTAISLYIFGREWKIVIQRDDLEVKESFEINNLFRAKGGEKVKEELARNLIELQELRNPRAHLVVEEKEAKVRDSKIFSYKCLKLIPTILQI